VPPAALFDHRLWTGYCFPSLPVMLFSPPGIVDGVVMPSV